jgi:hypothetical protein
MSARLLPLWFDALRALCETARPDEVVEYEAQTGLAWDAAEVAVELWRLPGEKYLVVDDEGRPVLAAGVVPRGRGWYRGWMIGSLDGWHAHWRAITRFTRQVMEHMLANDAHRLDVLCLASRTQACRWYMKGLKMRFEGAHPGMGANGETCATYARVRGS